MSTSWTFPYFSGAKNSQLLGQWKISPSDYEVVRKLPYDNYKQYKHRQTSDTMPHEVNNAGYLVVAWLAQLLFPFLGDLDAVRVLQATVHIALCLLILTSAARTTVQRLAFLLLYGLNPIVIQVVTYPFYYFWTCLPSVVLLCMWHSTQARWASGIVGISLSVFSIAIRPTIFLLSLWASIGIPARLLSGKRRLTIVAGCLLGSGVSCACFLHATSSPNRAAQFAHSRYIGLGAYSGSDVIDVEDAVGFAEFRRRTGIKIDTNPITGNWGDSSISAQYALVMNEAYWDKATSISIIKNALLNLLQSFSVGFPYRMRGFAEISAAFGALTLLSLALTRQWLIIGAVGAYYATFGWFYPPIPNYLFGAYVLTGFGWSVVLDRLALWISKRRSPG